MSKLEIAPRAQDQIQRIAAWWQENRPAAASLFREELADVLDALASSPASGVMYGVRRGVIVRRVFLHRSRYHVYFSFDAERDVVSVRAVWHAARGSGPPLAP